MSQSGVHSGSASFRISKCKRLSELWQVSAFCPARSIRAEAKARHSSPQSLYGAIYPISRHGHIIASH
jgi:hypothetical protein